MAPVAEWICTRARQKKGSKEKNKRKKNIVNVNEIGKVKYENVLLSFRAKNRNSTC